MVDLVACHASKRFILEGDVDTATRCVQIDDRLRRTYGAPVGQHILFDTPFTKRQPVESRYTSAIGHFADGSLCPIGAGECNLPPGKGLASSVYFDDLNAACMHLFVDKLHCLAGAWHARRNQGHTLLIGGARCGNPTHARFLGHRPDARRQVGEAQASLAIGHPVDGRQFGGSGDAPSRNAHGLRKAHFAIGIQFHHIQAGLRFQLHPHLGATGPDAAQRDLEGCRGKGLPACRYIQLDQIGPGSQFFEFESAFSIYRLRLCGATFEGDPNGPAGALGLVVGINHITGDAGSALPYNRRVCHCPTIFASCGRFCRLCSCWIDGCRCCIFFHIGVRRHGDGSCGFCGRFCSDQARCQRQYCNKCQTNEEPTRFHTYPPLGIMADV
ncbi:MAG: hypothetical protein BWY63_02950 [Chloroflexi bacterium ADurb.Bin360]|nr:MAG: hypothetical protein BWY63_02950 [Chloroflexi bacterium ADurb.Bin360]